MPIIYVEQYTREEIRANRNQVYVFGDNFARRGFGGQAREARHEPNTIGIPTKRAPTYADDAYLTDADFQEWLEVAHSDFDSIRRALRDGRTIVLPVAGLGTGLAQLPERAPRIYQHIVDFIHACEDWQQQAAK